MKKILLGTSALIGAALLASAATAGEDPKVTIGGFSTFEAGYSDSNYDNGLRNRAFRNDNEIHFNIAGKTDGGLGYGAEIDLQADIDGASVGSTSGTTYVAGQTNSGIVAHRTYGWVQGDNWGHLEFGSNDGVARTMKVDASNIGRATGGIDGDFKYFADANSNVGVAPALVTGSGATGTFVGLGSNKFITAPRLPVENGPATTFATDLYTNDTKITYYTPRFTGFQLGVSYAPSLSNRGQIASRVQSSGTAQDIVEAGLNYENQFGEFGFAGAATGEIGSVSSDGLGAHVNQLRAWNAGAKVTFAGFSIAGSYGDWRDSLDINGTKADYWTVGGAYETGPIGASVTYLSSENKGNGGQNNKFQDISVGIDYKLAPGLTPFAEYTYYDIKPSNIAGAQNKGNVVIVGSELSF